jgi:hypothetical protein
MKRKLVYLAVSLLLIVLALVFSSSPSSKAQGNSPCVLACQETAIAAALACGRDAACLEGVRAEYLECVTGCRP